MKEYTMTFDGQSVRVEVNWNAMAEFLLASGKDSWEGLSGFKGVKPSEIKYLMAACINEGMRLDGKERRYTPDEVGEKASMETMAEFIKIYAKASAPDIPADKPKKE